VSAPLGWGLVGPGGIAHRFADALGTRSDARLRAIVGRTPERSHAFAERWGACVHATVDALLSDPAVDAVYIATPHHAHADVAAACLQAGKPVLCEKPLAANAAQAMALVTLAHERGVFLMEALWTRYLPALRTAEGWLLDGRIGRVCTLQSSFGFHMPFDPTHRTFAPALAGGALLDIGIYNLSLSQWVMALQGVHETPRMQALGVLAPTGVEQRCAVQMQYADGTLSQFSCAFDSHHDNALRIHGERGHIVLGPRCWEPTQAALHLHGESPQVVHAAFAHNGFECQIDAAMAAIRAGAIEEPRMPHAQTLAVQQQIDELRGQLGAVRFPFEAVAQD
jgi:predicted dehydrogenase